MKTLPTTYIWVAIHSVMFLVGILCFDNPWVVRHFGKALAEAFGGGIAATGAAGLFIFLYVKRSESLSRTMEMLSSGGVTDLFEGRGARIRQQYEERLKKFDELDVIGFGLSSFREDFKADFVRWAKHSRVRILLLDPGFPSTSHSLANIRDSEEHSPRGQIAQDVAQFIDEYRKLPPSKNFEVRLMRCMPGLNIFRIDKEIFFGTYLIGHASRNSFTFICREGGHLYPKLREHFDTIWNDNSLSGPV